MICAVVAISIIACAYFLPVFPYRPYHLINPNVGWEPADEWLTQRHCDRFVAKLREYDEWCIRAGQTRVLITGKLKLDVELTGNFSQKAGPD